MVPHVRLFLANVGSFLVYHGYVVGHTAANKGWHGRHDIFLGIWIRQHGLSEGVILSEAKDPLSARAESKVDPSDAQNRRDLRMTLM